MKALTLKLRVSIKKFKFRLNHLRVCLNYFEVTTDFLMVSLKYGSAIAGHLIESLNHFEVTLDFTRVKPICFNAHLNHR